MPKNLSQRFYLSFLVSVSLFGLFLVALPTVFPLPVQEDFQWRRPLVGSVFGLICLLGMTAVFFPSRCSVIFHVASVENGEHAVLREERAVFRKASTLFRLNLTHGHHPICEGFKAHEFQIGKKTFCTACMGLLLGAFISLFGVGVYFFGLWNIGENASLFLIAGVLGVGLGLFQYMFFDVQWRVIRLLLNALFVFGTFLVLAGIDTAANSLILDFFVILLSVFWLLTRISLSKHVHNGICQRCSVKCEFYKK
jgi:hypothetical protein